MTRDPARPKGLRLDVDGVMYELDDTLTFTGYDSDGCATWQVTGPAGVTTAGPPELHVKKLPGRTRITLPMANMNELISFPQPGEP